MILLGKSGDMIDKHCTWTLNAWCMNHCQVLPQNIGSLRLISIVPSTLCLSLKRTAVYMSDKNIIRRILYHEIMHAQLISMPIILLFKPLNPRVQHSWDFIPDVSVIPKVDQLSCVKYQTEKHRQNILQVSNTYLAAQLCNKRITN